MPEFLEGSYLRVGSRVAGLHETPEGGWILDKYRKQLDFSILNENAPKTYLNAAPMFPVNTTAMKLLRLCDGTLRYHDIVETLAKEYGETRNAVEDAIMPFFERATKLSHIVLLAEAGPVAFSITGSEQFYMPVHTSIEITARCNFRCRYCYRSAKYAEGIKLEDPEIGLDQLLAALENIRDSGVSVVELTGGEPLMHPDILEIIKYCGENFRLCALLTNGVPISESLAKGLSDAGNFFVGVSLDGPNSEVVDSIAACKGAFEKVCHGIELLRKHHIPTRVAMTVIPENIDYMEETLLLVVRLQGTGFSAAPIMTEGRAKNATYEREMLCNVITRLQQLDDKYPHAFVPTSPTAQEEARKKSNCGAGWRAVTIGPEGDVRACLLNSQNWSTIGNLFVQSMDEIFSSPKVEFFRSVQWPREEVCADCEYLWYCGNCIMRGIDSALRRNPGCQWAAEESIWQYVSREDSMDGGRSACVKTASTK